MGGEDAGKKKFIRDFLQRIKSGDGFYDDVRIERLVRLPGASGEGSTARSLSGSSVSNITELLEDDLKHSSDHGYFTFRLINAHLGSGKTALLLYLNELAKTKLTYENSSVVSFFRLSEIQSIGGSQSFSVKFYTYVLGQTFWELLNNSNVLIKDRSKKIISDYLESAQVNELFSAQAAAPFCSKFRKYFSESGVVFEELLFGVIYEISKVDPRFTFAYLIDDLDHLKDFPSEFKETRSLIKALVRRAHQKFSSKVRLLIYLAGTSEHVKNFIDKDSVIESLIGQQVIVLNKGYGNEFDLIRSKIDDRIKGAFKGYKNFDAAWNEIKGIEIDSSQNLRKFYQHYVTKMLSIYEKYFKEEPEKEFEGNARELVESQCTQKWQKYLVQKAYSLSSVSTTTVLEGHAFDCYIELRHNGSQVARGLGEAKNYELLSSHLEVFNQWLEDVKFKSTGSNTDPMDLAFMIAPSCPSLLQRKLELKNINFIKSEKVVGNVSGDSHLKLLPSSIDINTASKQSIVHMLKGTRLNDARIDQLIAVRKSSPYKGIDDLVLRLKLTPYAKGKLEDKLKRQQICFSEVV